MAQTLGSVAVGSIVKIDENGSPVNYIVLHIGNPDVRLYGSACDGVWLLRQDIVENVQWNSTNANTLVGSTIMSTMAGYLGRYESHIQSAIKTVKIPYHPGNGEPFWNIKSGENGLECKLFPLGGYEVGLSDPSGIMPADGAKLDYFKSGLDTEANSKRIAKLNGAAAAWWLRSPVSLSTDGKFYILPDGSLGSTTVNPSYGALPAMIMDPTILVSDDGTVGVPASPTALNVPIQVMQGRQITVSWSAVDGVSSYILERKANTDAGWVQVYSGANTSFEETVGTWTSVQYRVKSFANGKYGDYTTSTSVSVVPLSALVISGSDGSLGTLTNDVQYSVSSSGTSVLTVTETINGVNTRTFTATNGADNKISVVDLPAGTGTIKITASTNPGSGVVSVTREWTYTKTAITFPESGGVGDLSQNAKTIWPKTIVEAVRTPGIWGGNLGLALDKLSRSVLYNRTQQPKYAEVKINLANATIGQEVNLPYNGKMVPHIVVHIGNPNPSLYDASCDGVWLLRKDIVENGAWNSSGVNTLPNSTIMTTMAGYVANYASDVRAAIKTIKVPYCVGNGSGTINSGSNGLECKVFPLGGYELGLTTSDNPGIPIDGTRLSYFEEGGIGTSGAKKRIAYLNGVASDYFTRSPGTGTSENVLKIEGSYGTNVFGASDRNDGIRPAFIVQATFTATYYIDHQGVAHNAQEYVDAGTFEDIFGNIIPMVSIETGSYIGTGVIGENNPSSLTFIGTPVFLLISTTKTHGFGIFNCLALKNTFSLFGYVYMNSSDTLQSSAAAAAKLEGKTVSWYGNDANPYVQLNESGVTYYYTALTIPGGAT